MAKPPVTGTTLTSTKPSLITPPGVTPVPPKTTVPVPPPAVMMVVPGFRTPVPGVPVLLITTVVGPVSVPTTTRSVETPVFTLRLASMVMRLPT